MPEPRDTNDSPACGARVDYHGGTCGKPVGHDSNCAPFVEPERMPCGHTRAAIVSSGEGTSYCGECVEACSPDDYETGPERVRDALRANLAGRVVDVDAVLESTTNLDDASVHYQQGWDAGHADERARIVAIIGPCNDEAWCADVDDCGWCRHGEFLIRQINGGPTDA